MSLRHLEPPGYGWLLDHAAVVAAQSPQESELGAAAFASHAVLGRLPRSREDSAAMEALAGIFARDVPSRFRRTSKDIAVAAQLGRHFVLHEGYRLWPEAEGSREVDRMREAIGERLIASSTAAWSRWGDKIAFRSRAVEILGGHAVPEAVVLDARHFATSGERASAIGVEPFRRVCKVRGTGGSGNLVIPPGQAVSVAELDRWVARSSAQSYDEWLLERWLPWTHSICVSCLLLPGQPIRFLDVAQQVVDVHRAQFIGASSEVTLATADLFSLVAWLHPLFEAMQQDGIAGVSAIDVIVGTGWRSSDAKLPSGSSVHAIECNPRINRHNRVGVLLERLARLWDTPAADLSWQLTDFPRSPHALETNGGTWLAIPPPPADRRPTILDLADGDRQMRLTISRAS